jgi:hypothetical protein
LEAICGNGFDPGLWLGPLPDLDQLLVLGSFGFIWAYFGCYCVVELLAFWMLSCFFVSSAICWFI